MRLYLFLIAMAILLNGMLSMFEDLSTVQGNVAKIYCDTHGGCK